MLGVGKIHTAGIGSIENRGEKQSFLLQYSKKFLDFGLPQNIIGLPLPARKGITYSWANFLAFFQDTLTLSRNRRKHQDPVLLQAALATV